MMRLFLDTSCWLAAAGNPCGASGCLLFLACEGRIRLITTPLVLQELADNVVTLARLVETFRRPRAVLDALGSHLEYAPSPSLAEWERWRDLVGDRDAHILAGAASSRADALVTLDARLLAEPVRAAFPLPLYDPRECLRTLVAHADQAAGQ